MISYADLNTASYDFTTDNVFLYTASSTTKSFGLGLLKLVLIVSVVTVVYLNALGSFGVRLSSFQDQTLVLAINSVLTWSKI